MQDPGVLHIRKRRRIVCESSSILKPLMGFIARDPASEPAPRQARKCRQQLRECAVPLGSLQPSSSSSDAGGTGLPPTRWRPSTRAVPVFPIRDLLHIARSSLAAVAERAPAAPASISPEGSSAYEDRSDHASPLFLPSPVASSDVALSRPDTPLRLRGAVRLRSSPSPCPLNARASGAVVLQPASPRRWVGSSPCLTPPPPSTSPCPLLLPTCSQHLAQLTTCTPACVPTGVPLSQSPLCLPLGQPSVPTHARHLHHRAQRAGATSPGAHSGATVASVGQPLSTLHSPLLSAQLVSQPPPSQGGNWRAPSEQVLLQLLAAVRALAQENVRWRLPADDGRCWVPVPSDAPELQGEAAVRRRTLARRVAMLARKVGESAGCDEVL